MRRIAIIHEWLSGYYGSERVLEQILNLYPEADAFCVAEFAARRTCIPQWQGVDHVLHPAAAAGAPTFS